MVSLAFDRAGGVIAAGDVDGDLYLWSTDGTLVGSIPGVHPERSAEGIELPLHQPGLAQFGTRALSFSADGSRVVTGGLVFARVWDLASGQMLGEISLDRRQVDGTRVPAPVRAVAFDERSGDAIVVASSFNIVSYRLGSGATGFSSEREFPDRIGALSLGGVDAAVVLDDGAAFLSQLGGRLVVLPFDGGADIREFEAQFSGIPSVAVSYDGSLVAVGGSEGAAVWSPAGRSLIARSIPRNDHGEVTLSADGEFAVLSSPDRRPIDLWSLAGESPVKLTLPEEPLSHIGWLGQHEGLISWDMISDIATLRSLDDLDSDGVPLGTCPCGAVTATVDGSMVALGGTVGETVGRVEVFDTSSGLRLATLRDLDSVDPESDRTIQSLSFNPSGTVLVGATTDGASVAWDTRSWAPVAQISQGGGQVVLAKYSPDGRFLVTVSTEGTILLRDPVTLQPIGNEIVGTTDGVSGISHGPFFSQDGRYMITTADGVGRLWDLEARTQVGEAFPNDRGTVAAASEQGPLLATFRGDRVLIWELNASGWYDTACRAAGRNLTQAEWEQLGPTGRPYEATCAIWPSRAGGSSVKEEA